MTRTRLSLALAGLAVLIATAGCVGFLTGDEPLEVEANAATVDDAALEETGYELTRSESPNRTMNISVADQSREVHVNSEIREYNRSVSVPGVGGQQVAQFSVYTAPSVSVAGRTVNPVGDWSEQRLVREALGSASGVDNVQLEENRTVSALGEDRNVSQFGATAETDAGSANVTIHLATLGHEGDFIVVVAAHPEEIDERERVDRLFRGLVHESDSD